jgi:hypothetical protein
MNNELIEFCMWFCGYDRETMEQVYNDWLNSPVHKPATEIVQRSTSQTVSVSVAKRKVCPQCKREFDHTEVPSGIFCCYACEYGY